MYTDPELRGHTKVIANLAKGINNFSHNHVWLGLSAVKWLTCHFVDMLHLRFMLARPVPDAVCKHPVRSSMTKADFAKNLDSAKQLNMH